MKIKSLPILLGSSSTPNMKIPKINFNEFKNKITQEFNEYCNSPKNNRNNKNYEFLISKDDIKNIKKNFKRFHSLIKIKIPFEQNYSNPFQSLSILKRNNFIVDDIKKSTENRQINLFKNSIKFIESQKTQKKLPKIKISLLNPKLTKKKKKIENKIFPFKKTNNFFGYYFYCNKNFPEGREQFSLNLSSNKNLFLLGGISSKISNFQLWKLNLTSFDWERIKQNKIISNRYGHSSVYFNNKIFVFGGRAKTISNFNVNKNSIVKNFNSKCDVFNGLDVFDLNDKNWYTPIFPLKNSPELRRNHVCELVGNFMLIHGGMSEKNEILNDVFILNLNSNFFKLNVSVVTWEKWLKLSVQNENNSPFLFGHSASLVVPREIIENCEFNVYNYPEVNFLNKINNKNNNKNKFKLLNEKIRVRGLYVFGGKSKKGISNKLFVLKIGKKPCEWTEIKDFKGIAPCERYFHSMNFYEKENFLIIHGGRNDFFKMGENYALNDTFIFDLDSLEYKKINVVNDDKNFVVFNRCCHSSIVFSNKLFIFGGLNNENYVGSSFFIINLEYVDNNENKKENENKIF